MTRKEGPIGNESGRSSSRWLSPRNPYTGDGRTTRTTTAANEVHLSTPEGERRGLLGRLRSRPRT